MTVLSVEVPPELLAAAKKRTGASSDAEVLVEALERLVEPSPQLRALRRLGAMEGAREYLRNPELRAQARR